LSNDVTWLVQCKASPTQMYILTSQKLCKCRDQFVQRYNLGAANTKCAKLIKTIVHLGFSQKDRFEKFTTVSPITCRQVGAPRFSRWASGMRMGTAQRASLGDLKATRKHQFCHKLVIGNWNINDWKLELAEEAKRYSPDVVGISWTKRRGSKTVELDDGWKLFYSSSEPAWFAQAGVGILVAAMKGSHQEIIRAC